MWRRGNERAYVPDVGYKPLMTAGNNPATTKAMRYAQYIRQYLPAQVSKNQGNGQSA